MWIQRHFLLIVLNINFVISFTQDPKLIHKLETDHSMTDISKNVHDGCNPPFHSFISPFLTSSKETEECRDENALIVLNSKINSPPSEIFQHLWKSCSLRICADGGANRLYEAAKDTNERDKFVPHLIIGDLDSLHDHVREYYSKQGCKVEQDDDQDCNDLDKALSAVQSLWNNQDLNQRSPKSIKRRKIYVYGAFGGRFDQEMASIHAMYRYASCDFQILLYTDETVAFLLHQNVKNEIRLRFHSQNIQDTKLKENDSIMNVGEGPTVGLIPISCTCNRVMTSGLKWNLDGTTPLKFGGNVFSTSNRAHEPVIYIECSEPLVFTAEMTRL